MIYEVPTGHMLTITGPCRAEVVGTEEIFTMSEVPPMPTPPPPPEGETQPTLPFPQPTEGTPK